MFCLCIWFMVGCYECSVGWIVRLVFRWDFVWLFVFWFCLRRLTGLFTSCLRNCCFVVVWYEISFDTCFNNSLLFLCWEVWFCYVYFGFKFELWKFVWICLLVYCGCGVLWVILILDLFWMLVLLLIELECFERLRVFWIGVWLTAYVFCCFTVDFSFNLGLCVFSFTCELDWVLTW